MEDGVEEDSVKLSEAMILGLGYVQFDPSLYLNVRQRCGCLAAQPEGETQGSQDSPI